MRDQPDVYLLAPLGTSPAVVTETMWQLVRAGHRVWAVELWVTHADDGNPRTSLEALRKRVRERLWSRLRSAVGDRVGLLPDLPERFVVCAPEANRTIVPGLTVFGFARGGRAMPDVRCPEDADAVAQQLHARVRHLCTHLPQTTLVGAIAGGRKNFAPALQGAFELAARPTDRLVHVLLHEDIERDPASFADYVAPEGICCGVPTEEQITAFDIPFPPLRALLPDAIWREALDRDDAVSLWARLRRNLELPPCDACLQRVERDRWALVITRGGEVVETVPLTGGQAETYAAIAAVPREAITRNGIEEWADYIHAHRLGRRSAAPVPPTLAAMEQRLTDVANATRELATSGLGEFAVHRDGEHTHIPAARRVTLPP